MTNYEAIKNMELEKMGHWFCDLIEDCSKCPVMAKCGAGEKSCNGFIAWLREEAK